MRSLDSEFIVKLHEVFETDLSYYLIMDYMKDGSLYDKID